MNTLIGQPASPGVAEGPISFYRPAALPSCPIAPGDPQSQAARLATCLEEARAQCQRLAQGADAASADAASADAASADMTTVELAAEILSAQAMFLSDPMLLDAARERIAQGMAAEIAWQESVEALAQQLEALGDEMWCARADDVRDVGQRVLRALAGQPQGADPVPAQGCIVAGANLLASEVMALARSGVAGLALAGGSPTAHAAILARALGIPMTVGLGEGLFDLAAGTLVQLDGSAGALRALSPGEGASPSQPPATTARQEPPLSGPAHTADGHRVQLLCNVGTLADAERGNALGAEGAGLVRSEFLFLDHPSLPNEGQQLAAYVSVFRALEAKPVVIRTWDLAADKGAWGEPDTGARQPGLGRGIRWGLRQTGATLAQLMAILRAVHLAGAGRARIMIPFVSTVEEWRAARGLVDRAMDRLAAEGQRVKPPLVGAMIEVPAAVWMADALAAEADFLSVGSNDLAQHLMATDRDAPESAELLSGLQPALLRCLQAVVAAGHQTGIPVSLCGEMASDPALMPLLVGLGFDSLSLQPTSLPSARRALASISYTRARDLASEATRCTTVAEVRALIAPPPETR